MNWLERDYKHLWHPFTQADEWERQDNLVIERAEGSWLVDTEGRRYLDGTASLWCSALGHRHPALDAALRGQLDRVAHSTMLGLTHPGAIDLAERLCALSRLDRCFFSDSGSTAVEVALKMAFQAKQQAGEAARTRFAALAEAYHGDTVGSVSVGGIDLFHGIYKPLLFEAVRLPSPERAGENEAACLGAARRLFAEHGHTLCALVAEPLVQGAAGMRMHSSAFLRELCALARAHGAYVILDEVATGFGRTGTMFACEQAGIVPDFLCLAKGLTGGYLPLAATLTTEAVYQHFRGPYTAYRTFFHGHTYTGNPLACAVALATLDELPGAIRQLPAAALREALASIRHPAVQEVRALGMMGAVVLRPQEPSARVGHRAALAARRHGAIVRNLGDAIVVMPPLTISGDEIGQLARAVEGGIGEVLG